MSEERIRKRLRFTGDVQGVGFRWRARHAAAEAGVTGWVQNEWDGSVTMELQGSEAQIDRVLQSMDRSLYIRVAQIEQQRLPLQPEERGFAVRDDRW